MTTRKNALAHAFHRADHHAQRPALETGHLRRVLVAIKTDNTRRLAEFASQFRFAGDHIEPLLHAALATNRRKVLETVVHACDTHCGAFSRAVMAAHDKIGSAGFLLMARMSDVTLPRPKPGQN